MATQTIESLTTEQQEIFRSEIGAGTPPTTESVLALLEGETLTLGSFTLTDQTDVVLDTGEYGEDALGRMRRGDNVTPTGNLVVPDIYSGTKELSLIGKGGAGTGSALLIDTLKCLGNATAVEGDRIRIFGRTVFCYKTLPNVTPALIGFSLVEVPANTDVAGMFWDLSEGGESYVYHDLREWLVEWIYTSGTFVMQSPSSVAVQQVSAIGSGAATVRTSEPVNPLIPQAAVGGIIELPFTLVAYDQGTAFSAGAVRVGWHFQVESDFA